MPSTIAVTICRRVASSLCCIDGMAAVSTSISPARNALGSGNRAVIDSGVTVTSSNPAACEKRVQLLGAAERKDVLHEALVPFRGIAHLRPPARAS